MTDQNLVDLLEQAADRHHVGSLPLNEMLTRNRRVRRRRAGLAAAVASLAVASAIVTTVVLSGPGNRPAGPVAPSTPTTVGSPTPAPVPGLPSTVRVSCTPDGITVTPEKIRTQPAGVSLVVSSSLPTGSYLTYASTGGGISGGDPLPATTSQQFLSLTPGTVTLGCDTVNAMGDGPRATLEVTDPDGNWRTDPELDGAGCGYGAGLLDWKGSYFKDGSTAAEAADAVAAEFTAEQRGAQNARFSARPAHVGYPLASITTWIVLRNDRPYATVLVQRTATGFTAGPDARCVPTSSR